MFLKCLPHVYKQYYDTGGVKLGWLVMKWYLFLEYRSASLVSLLIEDSNNVEVMGVISRTEEIFIISGE